MNGCLSVKCLNNHPFISFIFLNFDSVSSVLGVTDIKSSYMQS